MRTLGIQLQSKKKTVILLMRAKPKLTAFQLRHNESIYRSHDTLKESMPWYGVILRG